MIFRRSHSAHHFFNYRQSCVLYVNRKFGENRKSDFGVNCDFQTTAPLFAASREAEIFVPNIRTRHRRKEEDVEKSSNPYVEDCNFSSSIASGSNLSEVDREEEIAWEKVHLFYKFMLKPKNLSWQQFLREQTRYDVQWEIMCHTRQVMSFTISEMSESRISTISSIENVPKLKLIADCSHHNSINDLLGSLCQHWHAKEVSVTSGIRFVDQGFRSSEIIFTTRGEFVSVYYIGGNNLVDISTTEKKYEIIPSLSLATFTRLVLNSLVTLLNSKAFGFPNYKLCRSSHLEEVKRIWGTLRAAACLREEPLPVSENELNA